MRARGLKLSPQQYRRRIAAVAPHAGAWIETYELLPATSPYKVAPHAGAWIETYVLKVLTREKASRPMRARGLKHQMKD